MKILALMLFAAIGFAAPLGFARAQHGHGHDDKKAPGMSTQHPQTMPPKSALQPAEGASVKILAPKAGQVFNGDTVPLEFDLTKGKRGEHVHAYVDGELMGMFKSSKGTLTGIKPGQHTLELRVSTKDHNVELNAIDKVDFLVQQ